MHMFDSSDSIWQRTADRRTQLRRASGGYDDWPRSRRSALRHPVVARPGE
jgi:hypothetical protein